MVRGGRGGPLAAGSKGSCRAAAAAAQHSIAASPKPQLACDHHDLLFLPDLPPPPPPPPGDDDYLLFDCPGQIELYSHLSVFRTFVDYLKRTGWQVCVVSRLECPGVTFNRGLG